MELNAGTVVWAEVKRSDGMGYKARPGIVVEDDGDMVKIVCGTSQKALTGALVEGEFLVSSQEDRDTMGLSVDTRFCVSRSNFTWVAKTQVKFVTGSCPNRVLGRLFRAGAQVGAW